MGLDGLSVKVTYLDNMTNSSIRQHAIEQARILVAREPVYLDTETTGLEMADQIVEICILDHDGKPLVDCLVKPKGKIPVLASRIHGITDEMVTDAPTWPELWPQVAAALAGRHVAIYNADFDLGMMKNSHRKYHLSWVFPGESSFCVMKLYAQFYGEWNHYHGSYRWQKLEEAARQCKVAVKGAHRARADALMARGVLHYMAGRTR
jgi:DNA polymerase-3 subunit epsilon